RVGPRARRAIRARGGPAHGRGRPRLVDAAPDYTRARARSRAAGCDSRGRVLAQVPGDDPRVPGTRAESVLGVRRPLLPGAGHPHLAALGTEKLQYGWSRGADRAVRRVAVRADRE